MEPLTPQERRYALQRIATELDRQRQEAERANAPMLAWLIAQAMDEAKMESAK